MRAAALAAFLLTCVAPAAPGAVVRVAATGSVSFNSLASGPLAGVPAGAPATMMFEVDPDTFVNSASFPVRGYAIDPGSFSLVVGGTTVPLASPFPAGQTPYLVLRNNDPAVDGFYLSTMVDSPNGLPTPLTLGTSTLRVNYLVTYVGTTLSSLDLLAAVGTYNFNGLTNFNWVLQAGPFEPFGIDFEQMTIDVDSCYADCNADGVLTVADFGCFQTKFVAGDPYADCNGDTTLTVADFGCFQTTFVAGCP